MLRWWFTNRLSLLLAVGIAMLTLPIWLQAVLPPLIYYPKQPFHVATAVLHHGDTLVIQVERCNRVWWPLAYSTDRVLYRPLDREQRPLSRSGAYAAPGCTLTESRLRDSLPPDLEPGVYELHGVTTVQTLMGPQVVVWRTESFSVVDGD